MVSPSMPEAARPAARHGLTRIEPGDRLVVLARTLQARRGSEAAWEDADDAGQCGETFLGRALYRHRSIFRGASRAPAWSHLDLRYFRGLVPADALRALVFAPAVRPHLLRAEILLTTPASFVLPRDWLGAAGRPGWTASVEYIDVRPACLDAYRDVMRTAIGPAAADLVAAGRIGTFRTMETAAVLHHDPALGMDWNQIHLCEVEADGFDGFGPAFRAALGGKRAGAAADAFAGLDALRTIPRWTLNDPVVEADLALAQARDP